MQHPVAPAPTPTLTIGRLAALALAATALLLTLLLPTGAAGAQTSAISIQKSTNGIDADAAPGPTLAAGDAVTWTYEIVVGSETPLFDIVVTDTSGVTPSCDINNDGAIDGSHVHPGPLQGGQSFLCTASGSAIAEGTFASTARVQAFNFEASERFEAEDSSYYTVPSSFVIEPSVTIETLVNGNEADDGDGPFVQAGEPVIWTFVVTNTGNVQLAGIEVSNDLGAAVNCGAFGEGATINGPIAPGGSATCSAEAPAAEAGTGPQAMTGSVFAAAVDPDSGEPVAQADAQDPATYTPVQLPTALAFTGPADVLPWLGLGVTVAGLVLWLAGRRLAPTPLPVPVAADSRRRAS